MAFPTVTSKTATMLLATLLASFVTCQAWAAETLTVKLNDGSTLTGELHRRTNDDHLWLRFGDSRAVVLRGIAWDDLVEARSGGKPIEAAAIRALAAEQPAESETETVADTVAEPTSDTVAGEPTYAEQAHDLLGFAPRVASVDFEVNLANWDQDVEMDGLVLRLFPLDTYGQLTCARGTLNVELVAARRVDFNEVRNARGQLPDRVGQWTVRVNADEVTASGVAFKLPFQTNHPEFDMNWATHGLVHVRFVVPGQGVFEDSVDGVRMRPYAPLRDALERNNKQRFLPTEQTGVSRTSRGR
jgi:hypothetical protein